MRFIIRFKNAPKLDLKYDQVLPFRNVVKNLIRGVRERKEYMMIESADGFFMFPEREIEHIEVLGIKMDDELFED